MMLRGFDGERALVDTEWKLVWASTMRLKTGAARGVALRVRLSIFRFKLLPVDGPSQSASESKRDNLRRGLLSDLALSWRRPRFSSSGVVADSSPDKGGFGVETRAGDGDGGFPTLRFDRNWFFVSSSLSLDSSKRARKSDLDPTAAIMEKRDCCM